MSGGVLVVGAGPAGAATAARLAALGHRVLLLDRARFPRSKPCGECVNPAGVAELRGLGAWPRVEALAPAPLRGWRVAPGAGPAFHGRYPEGLEGVGVPRAGLDAALLEHAREAGAEVRTGARVAELWREGGRVAGVVLAGGERLEASVVVGADGLRSVVARRLGALRRPPRLRKLALTAHLEGDVSLAGWGELRTGAHGCLGLAAVGGGRTSAVLVVAGPEAARVAGGAAAYFDRALRGYGVAARRLGGVLATGPFDFPVRCAVANGALLVGDAAGYYDPFTGQGIFRALRGARLAAAALDAALRGGEVSARALWPYERARRAAFGPGERLQHLVEAFVSRPRLLAAVAGRLARRPALADALVRVTGDVLPAYTLLHPRLLARLVF